MLAVYKNVVKLLGKWGRCKKWTGLLDGHIFHTISVVLLAKVSHSLSLDGESRKHGIRNDGTAE